MPGSNQKINPSTDTDDSKSVPDTSDRFRFGANWKKYLDRAGERQFELARESLLKLFGQPASDETRFLDIGCGSGIFSLAALRLGFRVTSFDYDAESVQCAKRLRDGLDPVMAGRWTILQGSVLDRNFIKSLGGFDLVYAWGVLHHTGQMLAALENATLVVQDDGRICVALYNDEGWKSRAWWLVKRIYTILPGWLRPLVLVPAAARLWGPAMIRDLFHGHPLQEWRSYEKNRGMSPWRDIVDWVGGFPYEVASPAMVRDFFSRRGFSLQHERLVGRGHGCNEFTFGRAGDHTGTKVQPLQQTTGTRQAG